MPESLSWFRYLHLLDRVNNRMWIQILLIAARSFKLCGLFLFLRTPRASWAIIGQNYQIAKYSDRKWWLSFLLLNLSCFPCIYCFLFAELPTCRDNIPLGVIVCIMDDHSQGLFTRYKCWKTRYALSCLYIRGCRNMS